MCLWDGDPEEQLPPCAMPRLGRQAQASLRGLCSLDSANTALISGVFVFPAGERQLNGKVEPSRGWGGTGEGQGHWRGWSLGGHVDLQSSASVH